ncbi:MAG: hypothetical protein MI745_02065 [Pseudomonadales bacterium]|nr:hypothetical protein [Pseudomonadales bacterium]
MSTLTRLTQILFVRLFTQLPGRARNQRGASALEYIVLAAAIVVALVAASAIFGTEIPEIFSGLFDEVPSTGGTGGGEG